MPRKHDDPILALEFSIMAEAPAFCRATAAYGTKPTSDAIFYLSAFGTKRTCAVVLVSTASVAHDPKRLEQGFCREETSRKFVCCDVLKLACGLRAAYIYEGIDAPPFTAAQCPQGLRVRSAKRKFYARRRRVVCHAGRGKPASQGTRGDARHQALQPRAAATRYNECLSLIHISEPTRPY